jgi:hypothetical protein
VISSNSEGGVLGLAFAPDYASSGRLFVNFTDQNDNTVIARFTRATGETLRADPATRFDLVWSDGNAFIHQPYCCHYGGHLAFGPEGYLYIALGDGGAWDDPDNNAQNPGSPLGKVLRLDVNVPDDDARGYRVPGDNPFIGQDGVLAEIWDAGLRNPWRYGFDDPARGGTGAMIIADVGQDHWEEIDYEPAGHGGRNYGWRNREGAHDYIDTLPPWFEPLTDPMYEYSHDGTGHAIIGGYVYRGAALGDFFTGRYFFGDFMTGQLWSAGLSIDPVSGEAAIADILDHTNELPAEATDYFASFGQDANGELYVVSWWHGTVFRIVPGTAPPPPSTVLIDVDAPSNGQSLAQPFAISGWAADPLAETDSGVDYVQIWAKKHAGAEAPVLLGVASEVDRPDVAAVLGPQFGHSGFSMTVGGLAPDTYDLTLYAHSSRTNKFETSLSLVVTVAPTTTVRLDAPAPDSTLSHGVMIAGWAADFGATTGTGVDAVHIWAFPAGGGPPVWVGLAAYGQPRSDVAAIYGARFTNVGFFLTSPDIPPDTYDLVAYAHSTVTGSFIPTSVRITVTAPVPEPDMTIDVPSTGVIVGGPFEIAGWAMDRGADSSTGVDAIHIWAFSADGSGRAPIFVGQAQYGIDRPDVGAVFGAQFIKTGYATVATGLPSGVYDVAVYMHSTVAGTFNAVRVVRVTVQ